MDKFEQRMQQASEEVRDATRLLTPPSQRGPVTSVATRWFAFAAGATAVVLAVALLPGFLSSPPIAGPDSTQPEVTTPSDPTTTVTTPAVQCSATGQPTPGPVTGLPAAVAAKRDAVIVAALACDFDTLESLADPNFRVSFGGGGFDLLIEWETQGRGQLGTLVKLLDTTHVRQEFTEPGIPPYYTWPAAFDYDTWEEIPQPLLDELLTIYTTEELEMISEFGSYAGWRTGFTEDGSWMFFIAGD